MFSNLAQKFTAVKASILPTESDGDTEDDTHICRVLRTYYTEKGRAFPAWLPPDPRAPPPVVMQPPSSQQGYNSLGRAGYGGMGGGPGGAGGGANLSSLFDAQPQQQGGGGGGGFDAQGQGQGQSSLRAGGRGGVAQRHNPFAGSSGRGHQQQQQESLQVQARPLPSQRAGSQQSVTSAFGGRPDSGGGGGVMSAKDKLKMGFGQKRTASPALSESSQQSQGQYARNDYQTSSSGSRGYGQQQSYSGNSGGAPYPPDNYGGGGGGYDRGGGREQGGDRPFVASNAPWASNEMEFSGGGYDNRRQGLPGGPGAGRRGPGLPSGPRAPRF